MKVRRIGDAASLRDVELEDEDDCAACEYVHRFVKMTHGGVVFLEVGEGEATIVRRVEGVAEFGEGFVLSCVGLELEDAMEEIANAELLGAKRGVAPGKDPR